MVLDLVDENNWWKYKKCDNSGFDSNIKKKRFRHELINIPVWIVLIQIQN